ncbi:MAG: T9SS type A sorting domain-containing protein, partial [Vicingaceae bacterium]
NNDKAFVLAPTFGDVDGDGDQDMMLGDFSGNLHYFENTAGAGNSMNLVLNQAQYLGIDVGKNAAPQLIDLNRDALLDLVVGKQNGYVSYFENTGTSVLPAFSLITDSLGMVNTLRYGEFSGNSAPFVYEVSGSYKILSGSENGFIYQFGNIEGNLTGTFSVDSSFQDLWEGASSTIAMEDINNDNMLDVVIGNMSGGLTLFMGDSAFVAVNDVETEISTIKLYPNPANDELNVDLGDNVIYGATMQVYDVIGKVMFSQNVSQKTLKINISKFPSGMYFVIYSNQGNRFSAKIVKD